MAFVPPDIPDREYYPVDFRFTGKEGSSDLRYGVPNQDKARRMTIKVSHFLLHYLSFESTVVCEDQQQIPRLDVVRLTNVAGAAVASLEIGRDRRRKITNSPRERA